MDVSRLSAAVQRAKDFCNSIYMRRTLTAIFSFFAGLLCSRGLVFGKYAPFGVAAAAAAPAGGMWAAAAGAVFGYLLPSAVYVPFRYAAAMLAVCAIRWSLSELKAVSGHPLFAPVTAFLPLLLTGVIMVVLSSSVSYTAAMYVAESLLAAGAAYFLRRFTIMAADVAFGNKRSSSVFESGDIAALAVTSGIFILAFSDFTIGGVSLGRIFTILMVLVCARAGGISGGAVAGVTAGTVQGLSTAGLSYLSGAYGLGGLMAGVFSPMGKVMGAVAFILSHGIASLQAGSGSEQIFIGAIEVSVSTLIYMLLPKSRRLSALFGLKKDSLSGGAIRNNVVMRLKHASGAVMNVYSSVDEISKKLSELCAPSIQGVFDRSVESICAGCAMSGVCFRKHKQETLDNFSGLIRVLREKGKICTEDFTREFASRCKRSGEMRDAVNKNYSRYLVKEAAELRAAEVRDVAEQSFKTTAGILEELAGEFASYERFDDESAARVEAILLDNGVQPLEVCCRIDRFGRMTIEAELRRERSKRLNRASFTKEISSACGRSFSPPCISRGDESVRLQMTERPSIEVMRGFSQYAARGASLCGDCAGIFEDGSGRLIAILSDGMGTGGRAAVDGAMTTAMAESLLKAGIGFESALQTVNSALIAKSGDESLATLDVVSIDLYTGKAEFKKAGAAATIIRRGKRSEKIEASSVPVGIMPGVEFLSFSRELGPGDIVVMISDGVAVTGVEWIADLVQSWDEEENPNLLAERITEEAKKRRSDGHEDDITALVLTLC